MTSISIDRAGWPFVGGAAAAAVAVGFWAGAPWATPFVLLAGFFLFFFRDPDRESPTGADLVLSPADGRVLIAGDAIAAAAPPGEWRQVSIFLSPVDVHVNRVPASGTVTKVSYTPGKFLPAYRVDAGAINERCEIWIEHEGQTIVARQIVGILARRVVCRVQRGAAVRAGDRYGIMKFGSRMDIFLPKSSEIRAVVGDVVRGGETVIAVLH